MSTARGVWREWAWFLTVAALSSAWCLSAGRAIGPTFDEPAHLHYGLVSWRTGSCKQLMTWGAMPLPIDAQTLPIYLWEQWRGTPFEAMAEMDRLLPIARAASLSFWWAFLGAVMLWGRRLGGTWGGRWAVVWPACDPNFLGHAALAATDICLCATVLWAVLAFAAGRGHSWKRRVLLPGVLYGVALTSKASALPYVPLLCGIWGVHELCRNGALAPLAAGPLFGRLRTAWRIGTPLRYDLVGMMLIGTVWAFGYVGCDWSIEKTWVKWARTLPEGTLRVVMLALSENLPIFTNAGEGLVQQIKHNFRGHGGTLLLGEYHPRAVWYYFPVALSAKLPDATLVLLALGVLAAPRRWLRSPAAWMAFALLLFSFNTKVQIGVRLVFPLVALAYIALGEALAGGRPWLRWLAGLALAANAAEAAMVWPDGVRYVNRLHGGTDDGWKQLADSNYDWGQGVPDLKAWAVRRDVRTMAVWYYGGDPAILLAPFRPIHLHGIPDQSPAGVAAAVPEEYLAISIGLLNASPARQPGTLKLIAWLKSLPEAGRTPLFVVYRVPR